MVAVLRERVCRRARSRRCVARGEDGDGRVLRGGVLELEGPYRGGEETRRSTADQHHGTIERDVIVVDLIRKIRARLRRAYEQQLHGGACPVRTSTSWLPLAGIRTF